MSILSKIVDFIASTLRPDDMERPCHEKIVC